MRANHRAFTLMEIMVVIIIIAGIAGFAIPNYTKTIERAHVRDAMMQLETIHAANSLYNSRIGSFWPEDGGTYGLADINDNLGLNVIANGMTYSCSGNGTLFTCTATRDLDSPRDFVITLTQAPLDASNLQCTGCP